MKRVVVKISSQLALDFTAQFAEQIIKEMAKGTEIVVVSGGAVKSGLLALGIPLDPKPSTLIQQAAAGVGQLIMMDAWRQAFHKLGYEVAQLPYTHHDILDPKNNIREVVTTYFGLRVVPIVNGNDVANSEETRQTGKVSENSAMACLLAERTLANKIISLGETHGLYTADPNVDPNAQFIAVVRNQDASYANNFSDEAKSGSFGGTRTNVLNYLQANQNGIEVIMASGRDPENLGRIFAGEELGTVFRPAISS